MLSRENSSFPGIFLGTVPIIHFSHNIVEALLTIFDDRYQLC